MLSQHVLVLPWAQRSIRSIELTNTASLRARQKLTKQCAVVALCSQCAWSIYCVYRRNLKIIILRQFSGPDTSVRVEVQLLKIGAYFYIKLLTNNQVMGLDSGDFKC